MKTAIIKLCLNSLITSSLITFISQSSTAIAAQTSAVYKDEKTLTQPWNVARFIPRTKQNRTRNKAPSAQKKRSGVSSNDGPSLEIDKELHEYDTMY